MNGWVSPRLGVRFELRVDHLHLFDPDGRPFLSYMEGIQERKAMARRNEELSQKTERLAARLRALGIDPEE